MGRLSTFSATFPIFAGRVGAGRTFFAVDVAMFGRDGYSVTMEQIDQHISGGQDQWQEVRPAEV
jgi:hypothetical protein